MPAADALSLELLEIPFAPTKRCRSRGYRYESASQGLRLLPAIVARFEDAPIDPRAVSINMASFSSHPKLAGRPKTWVQPCPVVTQCQSSPTPRCQAHRDTRCRATGRSSWSPPSVMAWILLLSLVSRLSLAAYVTFENCLPDSYLSNVPQLLQWAPLYVDASFDTESSKHTLRVTMWGNVTGKSTAVVLPPPSSPDWTDPKKIDGKIADEPEQLATPLTTTLHSKVDMLTYEPWNNNTAFCGSLINGTCPLAPIFHDLTSSGPPREFPAISLISDMNSSYAFASFSATFFIINGDQNRTTIGCVSATVTPDLGSLAWMLRVLPLVILLFVGFATVFAGIFSPWGTADIFHWTSNYGRDGDLLRLVTPGFGDCLQYIQFVVLSGGLSLNYPGFYQPIVSQASWSGLMFNKSLVSNEGPWVGLQDGIYVTNSDYGLQRLSQLIGIKQLEDIWAGMIVWLLVIIGSMFVLVQSGFLVQWIYRSLTRNPEEDLRAKNIPFTIGNVVRIVLGYFLFPVVALSLFQLVVASASPAYTVALAALTLVLILGFTAWLIRLIIITRPRAVLFDDLPTVLLYGPLYNTFSDEAATYALIPVFCTFLRGIAVGAVQLSGVAQVVLLAIPEIIQILTLNAFRPFHPSTSMNAYHMLFSILRLVTVLLMIAFIPSLDVTEGRRGWIGYAILVIHAGVIVLGFFLNALQTIIEVVARMLGAGGDDTRGQSRGGLSKIFGMRQLSRRMSRRESGPSRQSQLSNAAMLDAEEASKSGYIMPGGRIRSESAGSMGVLFHQRHRSSSVLENLSLDAPVRHTESGASSFTPNTPGEASVFSFLPSPGRQSRLPPNALPLQTADPYYRPPRARRTPTDITISPADKSPGSWAAGEWTQKQLTQGPGALGDPSDLEADIVRGNTPAPYAQPAIPFTPRTDYSTREVDFYYGVRGQRLNSDAPSRKLGTGPADPTGPMASAAGWLRNMLGGKTKEKGKGFEVVRSSRMPPAMRARGGDFEDEAPPEGIPVAMGVLRNGPIESDDEDDGRKRNHDAHHHKPQETELLGRDGTPQEDDFDEIDMPRISDLPPTLPDLDSGGSIRLPSRIQSRASRYTAYSDRVHPDMPELPRKSSKRTPENLRNPHLHVRIPSEPSVAPEQTHLAPSINTSSRLPFDRTPSQKRLSGSSVTEDFTQVDLHNPPGAGDERPTSFGYVQQGNIHRVDRDIDLLGSSAEVVDMRK